MLLLDIDHVGLELLDFPWLDVYLERHLHLLVNIHT